jgi:hypothetical protein
MEKKFSPGDLVRYMYDNQSPPITWVVSGYTNNGIVSVYSDNNPKNTWFYAEQDLVLFRSASANSNKDVNMNTSMYVTKFFNNGNLIRSEKQMSVADMIRLARLQPGMKLIISTTGNMLEKLWIGDATPYMAPSTNDGGIGWLSRDWEDVIVTEVHTYE